MQLLNLHYLSVCWSVEWEPNKNLWFQRTWDTQRLNLTQKIFSYGNCDSAGLKRANYNDVELLRFIPAMTVDKWHVTLLCCDAVSPLPLQCPVIVCRPTLGQSQLTLHRLSPDWERCVSQRWNRLRRLNDDVTYRLRLLMGFPSHLTAVLVAFNPKKHTNICVTRFLLHI